MLIRVGLFRGRICSACFETFGVGVSHAAVYQEFVALILENEWVSVLFGRVVSSFAFRFVARLSCVLCVRGRGGACWVGSLAPAYVPVLIDVSKLIIRVIGLPGITF